jgi:hypothetical protein
MKDAANFLTLEECREEIKRLREENYHLRQASNTFGELAERLRTLLEAERCAREQSLALTRHEAAESE